MADAGEDAEGSSCCLSASGGEGDVCEDASERRHFVYLMGLVECEGVW